MDINKMRNFVPAEQDLKDQIFFEDDKKREIMVIKTNRDGLKYSIDGEMNFGAVKSSKNQLRIIFSFIKEETDNFVVDLNIPIDENIDDIKSYFNQNTLYVSFYYYENKKLYYGFSKSFKISKSQKKEILKMLDSEYPIIHKMDLADLKLKKIISSNYYVYKTELDKDKVSDYFLDILKKFIGKNINMSLWFSYDKDAYYVYSSEMLEEEEVVEKNKNPLDDTALPFGVVRGNTIFLAAINQKGLKRLAQIAGHNKYEEKYNLWN